MDGEVKRMAKNKYAEYTPSAINKKTIDLVTGMVGLQTAESISATIPEPAGAIVTEAAMPIAGLGMLGIAADNPYLKGIKR